MRSGVISGVPPFCLIPMLLFLIPHCTITLMIPLRRVPVAWESYPVIVALKQFEIKIINSDVNCVIFSAGGGGGSWGPSRPGAEDESGEKGPGAWGRAG